VPLAWTSSACCRPSAPSACRAKSSLQPNCSACRGLDDDTRATRISLTFSLKESLFKALYPLTLTRFYFHDAELLEIDHHSARLRLLIDLHPEWRAGAELDGQFALFDNKVLSLVAVAA
jgi:enterobactin synthetase component D